MGPPRYAIVDSPIGSPLVVGEGDVVTNSLPTGGPGEAADARKVGVRRAAAGPPIATISATADRD